MKLLPVFYRMRKSILLTLPLLLLGSYAIHEASGYSFGVVGQSTYGCSGGGCHGSRSTNTVISISTASAQIEAGKTYIFRISVANPAEHAAGCDISVDNGTLAVDSAKEDLQVGYGELTHKSPNPFANAYGKSGDSAVWLFKYTAPSQAGPAHIYAAGNAVNYNGVADAGDHWNLAVDTLTVVAAGVTPEANLTADVRIFPNPTSTGRLSLVTSGLAGAARMAVSDPAGKIVLRESLLLGGDSPLDLSALPNGIYFLSIRAKDGQSFMRRISIER